MPTAYTPGLTIAADTQVRKERLLPIRGEVLVSEGERVEAETPIARAMRPGNLTSVKVSERLGVDPTDLPSVMLKSVGDAVEAGEVMAETRAFFGLFHNVCESPVKGVIEHISPLSGYVGIREEPMPLETVAHISGRVIGVQEERGAIVESRAALIQGIFGVGGERRGILRIAARGPEASLEIALAPEAQGAVLLGGATADAESLAAAARAGATGVVIGGIDDVALRAFVGYDIGVAVTGQERVPFTLIITEGFGPVPMAQRTFELLASHVGSNASIDGSTQIRAGVIRPEILVPLCGTPECRPTASVVPLCGTPECRPTASVVPLGDDISGAPPQPPDPQQAGQLSVGAQVRLIREPYFGRLAVVTSLPAEPQRIETEALVRVAEVDLGDGRKVLVPRANVEMVHG